MVNMQNGSGPATCEVLSTTFADLGKQARIRCSVIEEIVQHEKEYVKVLHYVVDVMKDELDKCCEQIEFEVDEGHVRALFGNVVDVLDLHEKILFALEELLGSQEGGQLTTEDYYRKMAESRAGGVFVKVRDSFRTYEIYCANHTRSEQVAADLLNMTTLKAKLKGNYKTGARLMFSQEDQCPYKIRSYADYYILQKWATEGPLVGFTTNEATMLCTLLARPLHHICRLSVLLKILAVFTPSNHPDIDDVFSAIQIAQGATMAIDTAKRAQVLQRAYVACDDMQKKWEENSLLNKEGFLTKRGGSVKSWKIRWFTLRSNEMKYFDEPIDEKALTTLDLRQCTSIVENSSQSKPNCFGLTFGDRTYYMYAVTPGEKSDWMNLIAWKLYLMHSAEERARLAISSPARDKIDSVLSLLK